MSAEAGFTRAWTAEVLQRPPLITPARQYVWPLRVAGEEEALARGALQLVVRPREGGPYLLTCALGFSDPGMPTGLYGCPNADELCAVAGGYAYIADARAPERCTQVGLRPVVEVRVVPEARMLLFVGFHSMVAWGVEGLAWETARLSWEGIRIAGLEGGEVHGWGWDLRSDRELEFAVQLKTGKHTGGAFPSG